MKCIHFRWQLPIGLFCCSTSSWTDKLNSSLDAIEIEALLRIELPLAFGESINVKVSFSFGKSPRIESIILKKSVLILT
jgi:hypothetical protein